MNKGELSKIADLLDEAETRLKAFYLKSDAELRKALDTDVYDFDGHAFARTLRYIEADNEVDAAEGRDRISGAAQ